MKTYKDWVEGPLMNENDSLKEFKPNVNIWKDLVAFAGTQGIKSPLTHKQEVFDAYLNHILFQLDAIRTTDDLRLVLVDKNLEEHSYTLDLTPKCIQELVELSKNINGLNTEIIDKDTIKISYDDKFISRDHTIKQYGI